MSVVAPAHRSPAFRATSLSSWVAAVKRAIEAKGVDASALMRSVGMDLALLDDPLARYPVEQTMAFWSAALRETQDPLLGLHTAKYLSPATFHALGYALLASSNLGEYFERAARYFRIVTDAGQLLFERTPTHGQMIVKVDPAWVTAETHEVVWAVLDCFLFTTVRTCGLLHGPGFQVMALQLQRPAPAEREAYERTLRVVPVYGAADSRVLLSEAMLSRPLPHANAMLARINEEAAGRYLADLGQGDVLARLKRLLQERLPSGEPSLEDLAHSLQMTPRSLQRRLAELGTSFRDLIHEVRHQLALEYLRQPHHSISDIAYLLGFAEVSAFTRAFRRWTGVSPTAWRDAPPPT
ncbi:MAG: hypothetical protein RLZZ182_2284 [Pseudomonadota bacterium]